MTVWIVQGVREDAGVFNVRSVGPFDDETAALREARARMELRDGWSWSSAILNPPRSIEEDQERADD